MALYFRTSIGGEDHSSLSPSTKGSEAVGWGEGRCTSAAEEVPRLRAATAGLHWDGGSWTHVER